MDMHIIHRIDPDTEPDLYERDIPWGRYGMAVAIVDDPDQANYRELAYEALHAVARLTVQLDRANVVIAALRDELRAGRAA